MLKNFKYHKVLNEIDELEIYNAYTELALYLENVDSISTSSDFRKYVLNIFPSIDIKIYPLIENAWNAIYQENDKDVYPNRELKNVNMIYRKFIYNNLKALSIEELMYLHIELASEVVTELPKIYKLNMVSTSTYECIEKYKDCMVAKIYEIKALREYKAREENE